MRVTRLILAALVAISSAGVTAAEEPKQDGPVELWLTASVAIDEGGRVQDLRWDEASKLDAAIADTLTPMVSGWEFTPATADGRPASTSTGLLVEVEVEPLDDGRAKVRVVNARTGPIVSSARPPSYPTDAVRAGVSASLQVVVEVGADGAPVVRDVAYEGSDGADRHRDAFIASTRKALTRWTFHPEVVAGQAVQAPVSIPVEFCIGTWCETRAKADKKKGLPPGVNMAESSAVALKTDIGQGAI